MQDARRGIVDRLQLLAHELNAKPNVSLRLLELDRELLVPLWSIDRHVEILEVTELRTGVETYNQLWCSRPD